MGFGVRQCPGFGPEQVLLLKEKNESGNTCLDRVLPANNDFYVGMLLYVKPGHD